ncbi:YheC/YheD family protein [Alkaliphilus pronyensis]|uniref:YheC/YheD family protein n=1 Tax=Alkaliphilus pronyensis TaxID=1482732 RepID=A0A6I0F343_9FIRM|nr:YheC/YheD family protein [Alkaliphilus pronyensis]KAB3537311.1 YheC/YheD family protein [Alkaliphilus pronyensis]
MSKLYKLKAFKGSNQKRKLYLNIFQLELLGLKASSKIIIQVASEKWRVEIIQEPSNQSNNTLLVSKDILKEMPYYQGEALRLVKNTSKGIVLGPSIGLTISNKSWKSIHASESIKKRAKFALEKGILFSCFSLKSVDWSNNRVEAYCLSPLDYKRMKRVIPVPQIIHDRGSLPKAKGPKGYRSRGKVKNIAWINSTLTFGKWETYKALCISNETSIYLPETALFSTCKLGEYLQKYKYCYIKHNIGRRGKRVYRVEKREDCYLCKTGGSEVKIWRFNSLTEISRFLKTAVGDDLILQQGILLAEIEDSPFDMRVLVQKNGNNMWVITGVNYRIAKPGAIITNFAAGARDIFSEVGEALPHEDLNWSILSNMCLAIVNKMESSFGALGEVGLDIALDKKGKLWLIEANSRPSSIAYRNASP